jgi:peroxiredoxin family protein
MASPEKLSLIFQTDDFDRIHYALVLASAALATGKPVTLLFAMAATRALTPAWANAEREADLSDKGLATFEELLSACVELDAVFMVCEMGLRDCRLTRGELRPDVPVTEGSAVSFLADASDKGAVLYV